LPSLIRIAPGQKKCVWVDSPFPNSEAVRKEELPALVSGMLSGHAEARERLILGNVYLVLNLVGRYLHYWKQTLPIKDDLISEGIIRLVQTIDAVREESESKWLVHKIILRVNRGIEEYANKNLNIVASSFRTNERLIASGKGLELYRGLPIRDVAVEDESFAIVDLEDAIEVLQSLDNEELVDAVLEAIECQYCIDGVSEEQIGMIHELVRISKGEL